MKGRKLLMIPGPIEFEPEVLQALGAPTTSHTAPDFIASFGNSLRMMKKVWECPDGQSFIMAGSGTLAMDMAGANLIEPGDKALVISTGYFGERYAELLKRYGANVSILRSEPGETVSLSVIENALKKDKFKLMTFTHVDTSTGVMVNPKPIGELGRKYDVLTVLDGVCSVAGEEMRQQQWGIDMALTASQKAIGVPPGLALLVASPKAMDAWKNRKTPVGNYYCDWTHWLPIMQAYEEGRPSYFGTPSVNLVAALEVSLKMILAEGMENRVARHKALAKEFREKIREMEFRMMPVNEDISANTLSAIYFPESINASEFMGGMAKSDVIVAPGLLPELKSKYFRVGHMGSVNLSDIVSTIAAIENTINQLKNLP
ncbi:MAG: alanine--glyoxylate aminotransferase family protein [Bacteroidales bacterium]|nr:alanine--glyoxylate aminotransferase family protein [Bacteroidales bacterium]